MADQTDNPNSASIDSALTPAGKKKPSYTDILDSVEKLRKDGAISETDASAIRQSAHLHERVKKVSGDYDTLMKAWTDIAKELASGIAPMPAAQGFQPAAAATPQTAPETPTTILQQLTRNGGVHRDFGKVGGSIVMAGRDDVPLRDGGRLALKDSSGRTLDSVWNSFFKSGGGGPSVSEQYDSVARAMGSPFRQRQPLRVIGDGSNAAAAIAASGKPFMPSAAPVRFNFQAGVNPGETDPAKLAASLAENVRFTQNPGAFASGTGPAKPTPFVASAPTPLVVGDAVGGGRVSRVVAGQFGSGTFSASIPVRPPTSLLAPAPVEDPNQQVKQVMTYIPPTPRVKLAYGR